MMQTHTSDLKFYWTTSELVSLGVLTALIRVAGLAIALAGGGMNPIALILRNLAMTSLLVVLLHKITRNGTLSLYSLIFCFLSVLMMGRNLMSTPTMLLSALLVDGICAATGGYRTTRRILVAVLGFELLTRCASLGISYLFLRESFGMFIMATTIVVIAFTGCLLGLWVGTKLVHELRTAGVIRS